jgi:hypothetical protein
LARLWNLYAEETDITFGARVDAAYGEAARNPILSILSADSSLVSLNTRMNIFDRISKRLRLSMNSKRDADVLDHVRIHVADDWRAARLAEAAQRHGKPFKCASDALPREVLMGRTSQIAVASSKQPVTL